MPPAIPAAIGAAGSLAGGLLGGPSQLSTQTSQPIWAPGQLAALQQMFAQYQQALGMGNTVQQSDRNQVMNQINQSYSSMKPSLTADLTARGFGASGNMGKGFEGIDEARAGAQQQGEQSLDQQAMNRWLGLIGMGPGMIKPVGSTVTGTGTQNPGLGATVGNAISPLGAAFAVNNPFAPGGPSGGGQGGGGTSGGGSYAALTPTTGSTAGAPS